MFILCVIIIFGIIFCISFTIKSKTYNWEKISSYECGFQAFEDARNRFDVKYYLVAILFIIFDLELAYLFSWSLCLNELNLEGIISMFIFLFILVIGFIYEWKKFALDWN